jgi:hypothetical protein
MPAFDQHSKQLTKSIQRSTVDAGAGIIGGIAVGIITVIGTEFHRRPGRSSHPGGPSHLRTYTGLAVAGPARLNEELACRSGALQRMESTSITLRRRTREGKSIKSRFGGQIEATSGRSRFEGMRIQLHSMSTPIGESSSAI